MDAGLHIGIAAWIHAQGDTRGFAVSPALPIAMSVGDLQVATTMHDVVRAWEFAQLANGEVREGRPLDGSASPLWARHHRLLSEMDFAARAWDADEQAELDAALAVLFLPGPFPEPTPGYLLYEEYRKAHLDLEQTSASPADIAAVLALWVIAGRKIEVETAHATISRLMQRSSRPIAESERLMLHPDLLLSSPSGGYAPTTATPVSAADESTWLHGQASVDELDRAVADSPARGQWTAWRANRQGAIRFRFVALTLHRSWFTPSLYERRDWRLADGAIASAGDGVAGPVPAFADRMYLARVESMQLSGGDTGPRPGEPADGRPIRPGAIRVAAPRPAMLATRATPSKALRIDRAIAGAVRQGVVRAEPAVAIARRASPIVAGPIIVLDPVMRPVVRGHLELVPLTRLHARFALAESLVAHLPATTATPAVSPAFVIGLGCRTVPAAPNPNDSYQWAA